MAARPPIRCRTYGNAGPAVAVLHGGPGAPGERGALARDLAGSFRVLEPFQRDADDAPLTVARHVGDLRDTLAAAFPGERPALVGFSWGAMLALALAAAHPDAAGAVVLVGCGTFDVASRDEFRRRLDAALGTERRARLAAVEADTTLSPDARVALRGDIVNEAYHVDPVVPSCEPDHVDARGHRETWDDMLRLQSDGTFPRAFAAIAAPVLMLHGADDPHPGREIRDSLAPFVRRLEYVEFARCGHDPGIERAARDAYLATLRAWLLRHAAA